MFRRFKSKPGKRRISLFPILLLVLAIGFPLFYWYSWNQDWQSTRKFIPARVESVETGDRITAYIPQYNIIQGVRLIGIAINDSNKAVPAVEITREMLAGRAVYLETDTQLNDYTNSILAYIWLEKPDTITEDAVKKLNYNCLLLQDGYAVPDSSNQYNRKYQKIFEQYAPD